MNKSILMLGAITLGAMGILSGALGFNESYLASYSAASIVLIFIWASSVT